MSRGASPRQEAPSRGPRGVAALFPRQGEWTEAAYLSLPETSRIVELADGRLVIPDVPTYRHQRTALQLLVLMQQFVTKHGLGYICMAPMKVRLRKGKFREPDIVFMSRAHKSRLGDEYWGVPDLVVEVISPRGENTSGTERTDRRDKFNEYERAGVAEYWLVHPDRKTIEVYVLRDGAYELLSRSDTGQRAHSALLDGFSVDVSAVVDPAE